MITLCAYSVAWSSATVSIVREGSPLCIAVPPMASVMVWFSVLHSGLIASIFHPMLLSFPALHAPSEDMKRFTHSLKYLSVLCRLYS